MNDLNIENKFIDFKNNLYKSKKYWIIFLIIILLTSAYHQRYCNYLSPAIELFFLSLIVISGIFAIVYYQGHNNYKELYKTAFIVIVTFGIITCFLTPMLVAPDEVEHFVRSEMTSRGIIYPEYDNGSFYTIQSTLDLIETSKTTAATGFDLLDMANASIMRNDADTMPINQTFVKYPSAFAQNPFYGYLPQAVGIAIAKLLDLNAVWMLWLGRIFNIIIYAALASIAVKKTPVLKIPMFVLACLPLSIYFSSSVSIDAIINGMGLITIAYFFYLYKAPPNSLNKNHIIKFTLIVLILGLCKVTYFAFILLLFCIPRDKFENNTYRIKAIISLLFIVVVAILWSKYYVDPGYFKSFRAAHNAIYHVNSSDQINYMLNHIKDTIIMLFNLPSYLEEWNFMFHPAINFLQLLFLGSIILLYPTPKFKLSSKIGAFFVFLIIFIGTYLTFLTSWTQVGSLFKIAGVQTRYFIPSFGLIPFFLGINHIDGDKNELDFYVITIVIAFVTMAPLTLLWGYY